MHLRPAPFRKVQLLALGGAVQKNGSTFSSRLPHTLPAKRWWRSEKQTLHTDTSPYMGTTSKYFKGFPFRSSALLSNWRGKCADISLFYYQWSLSPSISATVCASQGLCVYINLIDEEFIRLMGSAGADKHPATNSRFRICCGLTRSASVVYCDSADFFFFRICFKGKNTLLLFWVSVNVQYR